jgi:hypothetical protein
MAATAKGRFAGRCLEQPDGCRGFDRLFDELIALPAREAAWKQPGKRIELKDFAAHEPVLEIEKEN